MHSAGFVAAAYFLSSPWVNSQFLPATPHFAALTLFPVIVYASARGMARPRDALLLGLAIAAQCLTEVAYVAPALLSPLLVLAVARVLRARVRHSGLLLLGSVALAVALLSPVLLGYGAVMRTIPDLAANSVWGRWSTTSALPYVFQRREFPAGIDPVTLRFVLAGAIAALWRRRRIGPTSLDAIWAAGWFWMVTGAVLSIETNATLFGAPIHTPKQVVALFFPMVGRLRLASRLGIAALFGEAILAGAAFAEFGALAARLAAWSETPWLRALMAGALVASTVLVGLDTPLPRWDTMPRPSTPASFVAELRRRPGPLLVLPLADRRFVSANRMQLAAPIKHARAMVESIDHWQPMLNGYSSYFPTGFLEEMDLATQLPEPRATKELVRTTGLRHVWLRLDELSPADRNRWNLSLLFGLGGFTPVAREGDQVLLLVAPTPAA
jgi:hypothetical protein